MIDGSVIFAILNRTTEQLGKNGNVTDWLTAIGTMLSAIVAVGIAGYSFYLTRRNEQRHSRMFLNYLTTMRIETPKSSDGQIGTDEGQKIEITAGGPGSNDGLCCGITTTLGKEDDGKTYFQMSTEDWRDPNNKQRGRTLCEKGSCMGQTVQVPDDINAETRFSWHAQKNMDGSYTYCGKLDDESSGCLDANGNPYDSVLGYVKSDIKPGVFMNGPNPKKDASDPSRCRTDGFDPSSPCTGTFTMS